MRSKVIEWFVICAVVFSIGAHWPVLQSLAWIGMAVSFSQTAPLKVALQKTFDGQHPCKLCDIVKTGQRAERKDASKKLQTRLDFWLVLPRLQLFPPELVVPKMSLNDVREEESQPPPRPPPRFA